MLVLSRRKGESLVICDDIKVTFLGFDFQKESGIFRINNFEDVYVKKNDSFSVCDNVKINIVEIRNERVKIGINAPKEVPIFREEVVSFKKI